MNSSHSKYRPFSTGPSKKVVQRLGEIASWLPLRFTQPRNHPLAGPFNLQPTMNGREQPNKSGTTTAFLVSFTMHEDADAEWPFNFQQDSVRNLQCRSKRTGIPSETVGHSRFNMAAVSAMPVSRNPKKKHSIEPEICKSMQTLFFYERATLVNG